MNIKQKLDLGGKIAVVTGASRGIGKEIARSLGQLGAWVVLSSRSQESVQGVVDEFTSQGIKAMAQAAHMGDFDQIGNLVSRTVEQWEGIDIIVNNAAINPVFGPLIETEESVFDKMLKVNVKGPLELCRLAVPIMKKRGGGSIINISSVEGLTPSSGLGIYSLTKAALISLSKSLAKELAVDGIRVNAICPGIVETKFSQALTSNDEILTGLLASQAIQRVAQPEEMGGLAAFLASDASSYCTGAVFTADGGYTS